MSVVQMDFRESVPGRSDWQVRELKTLTQSQLMELFLRLPCPTMEEMNAEFHGEFVDHGALWLVRKTLAHFALGSAAVNGQWQGKGFARTSAGDGYGYNRYVKFGRDRYILPMKTRIARSVFDGKDCFELDYTAYYSQASLINMIDEVRKIHDDLYLGMGLWGYTRRQRRIPFFFSLSGPRRPLAAFSRPQRERTRAFSRYD